MSNQLTPHPEYAALSCVFHDPKTLNVILDAVGSDASAFTHPHCQEIYSAMLRLALHDKAPVDISSVYMETKSDPTILNTLLDITNSVPSSGRVDYYADMIRDAHVSRQTEAICARGETDPHKLLEAIRPLTESPNAGAKLVSDTAPDVIARLEAISQGTASIGLPTGFPDLDTILRGGLQREELIVCAARPSHGKTAFALNVAHHIATTHTTPVLLFSLEMGRMSVIERLFGIQQGVRVDHIREGNTAPEELSKARQAAKATSSWPFWIDDTPSLDIYRLGARARQWHDMHGDGNGVILVDYIQLIAGDQNARSREQDVAAMSRELKSLARDTKCPVLALCQLNRDAEKEPDHYKKLACMRESGAIEQDADVAIIIARTSADEATELAQRAIGTKEDLEHSTIITVAKHRNGPTGQTYLKFDGTTQRFSEVERPASTWRPALPPESDDDVPF